MDDHIVVSQVRGHQPTHTGVAYTLRKTLEVYTEVYIVLLIFVYFHVILSYLVSTLLDYTYLVVHFSRTSSTQAYTGVHGGTQAHTVYDV